MRAHQHIPTIKRILLCNHSPLYSHKIVKAPNIECTKSDSNSDKRGTSRKHTNSIQTHQRKPKLFNWRLKEIICKRQHKRINKAQQTGQERKKPKKPSRSTSSHLNTLKKNSYESTIVLQADEESKGMPQITSENNARQQENKTGISHLT